MTLTRSILLALTWMALAALLAFAITHPWVFIPATALTLWGVRKAAKAGPVDYTADRPTLRPGFMAQFGEVEKTCCHGRAK
jgi:hypothetical protein